LTRLKVARVVGDYVKKQPPAVMFRLLQCVDRVLVLLAERKQRCAPPVSRPTHQIAEGKPIDRTRDTPAVDRALEEVTNATQLVGIEAGELADLGC
jgi:hypothetical protein